MNFLTEKLGFEPELNKGLIASVIFHVALFLFAWFGVPHLFEEELIVEPSGIQATMVTGITAAPKVDKASKKVTEKPKEVQKVEPPKKETKPAPAKQNPKAAAAPPPEATEEVAVAIPDKAKPEEKKVEKKPEEKKVEEKPKKKPEEKKKPTKKDTNELDSLLASVLNDPAAEPAPEEPKKKATPKPEEPSSGPQTEKISDTPMTASDQDGIKQQLIPCWNFDMGTANPEQYVVTVRATLDPSGAVLRTQILDQQRMGDPRFFAIAKAAERSLTNPACTPLHFPPGKSWGEIDIVFDLAKAINGGY